MAKRKGEARLINMLKKLKSAWVKIGEDRVAGRGSQQNDVISHFMASTKETADNSADTHFCLCHSYATKLESSQNKKKPPPLPKRIRFSLQCFYYLFIIDCICTRNSSTLCQSFSSGLGGNDGVCI